MKQLFKLVLIVGLVSLDVFGQGQAIRRGGITTGYQPTNSILTSLTGLSGNGIVIKNNTSSFVLRSITGTANQITVSNGDGVSANVAIATVQDIATNSTPTFDGLLLTNGMVQKVLFVTKAADQSLDTSITPTAITSFSLDLLAGKTYKFRAYVPFSLAGVASGYRFQVTGPATPTIITYSMKAYNGVNGTLALMAVKTALSSELTGALAAIGTHCLEVDGTIKTDGAGSLGIEFAQNVSDAGAIVVLKGAYLEARLVD